MKFLYHEKKKRSILRQKLYFFVVSTLRFMLDNIQNVWNSRYMAKYKAGLFFAAGSIFISVSYYEN